MITSVTNTLAQQIVNTIKDVCRHDINFISPSGIILASTNEARVGTFHEAGRQAALSKTTFEVEEDDAFAGTKQGINMPISHEGRLLAVIGISGKPDEVRQYAYLAERITILLFREQELNLYSRRQADKKHFIIQTLLNNEAAHESCLIGFLNELHVDLNEKKRLILIRINPRYNLANLSFLEQSIEQVFDRAEIVLYTFFYPGDFLAVIDEPAFWKHESDLKQFAQNQKELLKTAVGKSTQLFNLYASFESAGLALKSIEENESVYVLSDDLYLELILSSVSKNSREEYLHKTADSLTEQDFALLKAYFSEDMSLATTSSRLYLHKNTLQYKLNHIYRKCGLNPRRFRDAVLLYLAVKFHEEK